jgi:AP-3 complex subunit beta
MISKGRNVSEYFAQVVKNVASPSLEVRKLVYIYLLRYAEAEPDLALLSINTFQRDLADSSPLIRAMALRVLSGIRVPTIASLVVLAIKKCAADTSPYVRKAAALSIPKCYRCAKGGILEGIRLTRVLQQPRRVSTPVSDRDIIHFTARSLTAVYWQRCHSF